MTEFSKVSCGYKIKSSKGFKISVYMHLSQKWWGQPYSDRLLIAYAEVKFLHLEMDVLFANKMRNGTFSHYCIFFPKYKRAFFHSVRLVQMYTACLVISNMKIQNLIWQPLPIILANDCLLSWTFPLYPLPEGKWCFLISLLSSLFNWTGKKKSGIFLEIFLWPDLFL